MVAKMQGKIILTLGLSYLDSLVVISQYCNFLTLLCDIKDSLQRITFNAHALQSDRLEQFVENSGHKHDTS